MPMKNSSTLIYLVKNFLAQSGPDSDTMNRSFENSINGMEKTGFLPSERSIQKILDFARSYEVVETETTGQIEMNYN